MQLFLAIMEKSKKPECNCIYSLKQKLIKPKHLYIIYTNLLYIDKQIKTAWLCDICHLDKETMLNLLELLQLNGFITNSLSVMIIGTDLLVFSKTLLSNKLQFHIARLVMLGKDQNLEEQEDEKSSNFDQLVVKSLIGFNDSIIKNDEYYFKKSEDVKLNNISVIKNEEYVSIKNNTIEENENISLDNNIKFNTENQYEFQSVTLNEDSESLIPPAGFNSQMLTILRFILHQLKHNNHIDTNVLFDDNEDLKTLIPTLFGFCLDYPIVYISNDNTQVKCMDLIVHTFKDNLTLGLCCRHKFNENIIITSFSLPTHYENKLKESIDQWKNGLIAKSKLSGLELTYWYSRRDMENVTL